MRESSQAGGGPRILGFSGLAYARQFKRSRMAGLDEREYAIFQGADAAAALIVENRVIAASAEERFDGVKHSEAFPRGAAEFCLDSASLSASDLDCVAHSFSYGPEQDSYACLSDYYRSMYAEVLSPEVNRRIAETALGEDLTGKFLSVSHHLSHAASAYIPSGFHEALVLVSDGLGERNSSTVFVAHPEGFETLSEIPATSSLGFLYGLFTLYLGFQFGDGEYKVMGLAPYGDPAKFAEVIMREWVHLESDGRYLLPILLENVSDHDKETFRPALRALERELGPPRDPDAPIEQRHMDVAAGIQTVVQTVLLHILRHFQRKTGQRQLCIAGGVGLNCVANGMLLRSRLFEDIYVQPASGDDGAAFGAALVGCRLLGGTPETSFGPFLGPSYSHEDCRRAAERVSEVEILSFDNDESLVNKVASLIEDGCIIGWFQGRMEFGPRALGNRSILADPRRAEMKDRINALIKKRESFRPFAPAVAEESAHEWFEIESEDVHRFAEMLIVAHVKRERADVMPAVTHVDGSARVQTVSQETNPIFWKLIHAFGERTGVPVILNTSLNTHGQPIVRSPDQAMSTFVASGLDALVMDKLLILPSRASQPPQKG